MPATAALRELLEETGYQGRVTRIGQLIAYEPGLTNSGTRLVHVEVLVIDNIVIQLH